VAGAGRRSLVDWVLGLAIAASVLYIPWIFEDLAFRVGNPLPIDVVMGSILVVLLLEATRRAMGWPLPVIAIVFMLYALAGPAFPGLLKHSGAPWSSLVNHLYMTSQGIYGIAVGVVATFVFHFVLFGVLATRIGLGQLFIDIASAIAGRYAGGPAKVSVFASALFGMLSGSSVANAVTVGSLTIPAMVRLGYPRHFAGAVEAASSTGGQITPPIMGAAAFLMIEFLNLPYQTIIIAAIVPAFMHFYGVFMQVHFEAKRTGLRGLTPEELPDLRVQLAANWPTLIPLVLLIAIIVQGSTPYLAAFTGISSATLVGFFTTRGRATPAQWVALAAGHAVLLALITGRFGEYNVYVFLAMLPVVWVVHRSIAAKSRIAKRDLVEAFETGAKYALAVGAAAATVGIVIGVVTLTGVGFKLSYIITSAAQTLASTALSILPTGLVETKTLTLLAALIMTAVVCVLMGCGIPTTANYIIMVTVAAPTLVLLGVQPLVAHYFVFYYGVLADITPPVALAAYAAAGMAGSDPFKTGNTAISPRARQGARAVRVRIRAIAAARHRRLHVAGVRARVRGLRARHYVPVRGTIGLLPRADAAVGARGVCRGGVPDGRAGAHQHADRDRDGGAGPAAASRSDEARGRSAGLAGGVEALGLDLHFEQRGGQRFSVRVDGERRRDAAVERVVAHELQRAELRKLVAADLTAHDAVQVLRDRGGRHPPCQQRIVGGAIGNQRQDRRVAFVAGPTVREVIQLWHGSSIGEG
jgi:TRAP transporter 4TM/12TM fusion protein